MIRVFFFLFFMTPLCALYAQQPSLMVQLDNQQKPYLNHTIGGKENFYSIGRMYNISPRVYAPYNGLELSSGLSIGQVIKIPLNETNFWQSGSRKGNETVVPVYHTVQAKETLTALSVLYHTDKAALMSWNNLNSEKISIGEKIIIGFLKVDKNLSPLAAQGMGPRAEPKMPVPEENKIPSPGIIEPVVPVIDKKESPRPQTEKKQENKKEQVPKVSEEKLSPSLKEPVIEYKGNGFFETDYKTQLSNRKALQTDLLPGGTFKSTSGWSDGKYYILIDGIEKGKIIKLSNPVNQKFIFAKVLASVAETKPGAKEMFLISNAAAAQLGTKGSQFEIEVIH